MEMCYDGALVMPSSYAVMDEDEMMYVEGGATNSIYGTAKYLAKQAAANMVGWISLAGGYTYAAAAAVASAVGVGVGVIAGIGASYCSFAANEFRVAFNYFSEKSQTSSTKYKMTIISLSGIITGVSQGLA